MAPTDPAYYKKDPAKLNPATRRAALREYHALAYEIQMLGVTAELALRHWADERLRNVLIESYALHLRNLALFLWPKEQGGEWVAPVEAAHYALDGQAWNPLPKPVEIDALVAKASQQIAHLTTARLSDPEDERKKWALKEGLSMLRDGLVALADRADPTKLSPNVEPAIRALRETLAPAVMLTFDTFVGSTQLLSLTVLPSTGD